MKVILNKRSEAFLNSKRSGQETKIDTQTHTRASVNKLSAPFKKSFCVNSAKCNNMLNTRDKYFQKNLKSEEIISLLSLSL